MENRPKFNLIQSINSWKKALSKSGALTNDNILELESHLLDEIEKLKTQELSEEECFLIAKKRIGKLDSIKSEYEKVNVSRTLLYKIEPYLKGVLIYLAFLSVSKILFYSIVLFDLNLALGISYNSIIIGVTGILILISISSIKFPKGIGILNRLNNVFILLMLILISKPIEYLMQVSMTKYFDPKIYGMIQLNSTLLQLIIFVSILIGSFLLITYKNKSNKLMLQK